LRYRVADTLAAGTLRRRARRYYAYFMVLTEKPVHRGARQRLLDTMSDTAQYRKNVANRQDFLK
jgi:hypothetical protein